MPETYLAVFARPTGRSISDVGSEPMELFEGAPLDTVIWFGESWTRVSDLRHGEAHYLPQGMVSVR